MRWTLRLAWMSLAARDLLWPPACPVCEGPAWDGDGICASCAASLPPPGRRCPRCGRGTGPFGLVDPCTACRGEELRLDGVVAAYPYRGAARDLVLALKFRGRLGALSPLAAGLADAIQSRRVPGDLLVPVPLSARRLRQRGYDQAALLARGIARELDLDLDLAALCRHRHTAPQVGLSRRRRQVAPRGAFRACRARVRGRAVLLVDDVLTTGGTCRAAAIALRRAGALAVVAAVACRTDDLPSVPYAARMETPVVEISGQFADEVVAREVADALNRWFRWILDQGPGESPETEPLFFEPFGVDTAQYAWTLGEDVDWEMGPHARAVGPEVRVAIETQDTHFHLAGLLRKLGAQNPRVTREE